MPRICPIPTATCNHDELTLDKLDDAERQEVFAAFGPDPAMQVYGRGLRRRLPPMLGGDAARVRLVYSLLFSLPGTPTLFYGEELGMGENLRAEGRFAVRTPMQWSDGPNGGFSTAEPGRSRLVASSRSAEETTSSSWRRGVSPRANVPANSAYAGPRHSASASSSSASAAVGDFVSR